jgi:hypothetical protein
MSETARDPLGPSTENLTQFKADTTREQKIKAGWNRATERNPLQIASGDYQVYIIVY